MVYKALKKVSFLKGLVQKDIGQILSIAKHKKFKAGEIIFHKSEIGNHFFIVKSGKIKIFTFLGPEKKKTFAFLSRGDMFGEMSLLGGKTRSASAQAIENTELLVISKKNFRDLIMSNPDFTFKLLNTVVERLNKANKEIESMLFHNILGRLADSIIELSKNNHSTPVCLKIDQNELAECVGTTRVPVCRAINILKRSKTIEYKRGELKIMDMQRLKSIAGSGNN
ncbi:MAG: Crp/Fnr family transcriptional regulator [Elusimicrobia bacterium]|nr:Crp/Fnr family transcriptional regulator [Elusimicrobiota bacterium]